MAKVTRLETKVVSQKKPNEKASHPNDMHLDLSDINKYYKHIVNIAIRIINSCIHMLMCIYGSPGMGKNAICGKIHNYRLRESRDEQQADCIH